MEYVLCILKMENFEFIIVFFWSDNVGCYYNLIMLVVCCFMGVVIGIIFFRVDLSDF